MLTSSQLHPCGGSGSGYFGQTSGSYVPLADSTGSIIIYPSSPKDSNCWDASTQQSNTHDGGGDTQVLVNMVDYVLSTYNGDPSKVFVTGSSSGCIMTNLISAVYPDVFAAGSCYSGMPAGCLYSIGSPGSSPISADPACANGQVNRSGEEWAEIVHNMYPGYTGDYPRMLTWHGTADNLIFIPNLDEQLKLWSTVLGESFTEDRQNTPEQGYTWKVYGDGTRLVGVSAEGVGHTVPVHGQQDFEWFGLV